MSDPVLLSKSFAKQFEFLALSIVLSGGQHQTIVGCYRPPSVNTETLSSLMQLLYQLKFKEIILEQVCLVNETLGLNEILPV